ncbi:hypothetical protein [Bacillus sp. ISL-47]|uniref:hypothetical protein n=1 Tax=Bacillus sp. ISL-47 TaxID=2819130 RepID=UPI001BEA127C
MFYFSLMALFCLLAVLFIVSRKMYISTSTMAAVMALGIVTQGVLLNFFGVSFFLSGFGKLLSMLDLALWIAFLFSFSMTIIKGEFKNIHYANPINRFGIGTWVGGTSICGIIVFKQFGSSFLVDTLAFLNVGLWMYYVGISIKSIFEILSSGMINRVHGILLLTTVSTQSLVLLFNTINDHVPAYMNGLLIIVGFSFYIISALCLFKRYSTSHWSVTEDWNNTNCILHGALSITGLAMIKSGLVSGQTAAGFWIGTLIVFLFVESIESIRLMKRIRLYGLKKGVFTYDVTQWSRIFTFAMFFTFTYFIESNTLLSMKEAVLHLGIWMILALFLIELFLSLQNLKKSPNQTTGQISNESNSSM